MLPMTLIWAEVHIFIALALLHLHWGFGGTWGFEKSLPTNEEGKKMLNPTKKDSLIVGVGLLFFATFYILKARGIELNLPAWVMTVAGWLIPAIFLLRAMGDFKYIGFFKKVRSTDFGRRDTWFYSPLCLIIGIMGVVIAVYW